MFPMVPYYRLPELHEEIKHDCAPVYPSLWAAYKEIIPAVLRQPPGPGVLRAPRAAARRRPVQRAHPAERRPGAAAARRDRSLRRPPMPQWIAALRGGRHRPPRTSSRFGYDGSDYAIYRFARGRLLRHRRALHARRRRCCATAWSWAAVDRVPQAQRPVRLHQRQGRSARPVLIDVRTYPHQGHRRHGLHRGQLMPGMTAAPAIVIAGARASAAPGAAFRAARAGLGRPGHPWPEPSRRRRRTSGRRLSKTGELKPICDFRRAAAGGHHFSCPGARAAGLDTAAHVPGAGRRPAPAVPLAAAHHRRPRPGASRSAALRSTSCAPTPTRWR